MRKYIPNTITTLNLICGTLSIFFSIIGNPTIASYLIFVAALFDFLDGFAARILNAYSDLGKQLDSLADLVSFGLAPSFILFFEMVDVMGLSIAASDFSAISFSDLILLCSPLFLVVASAFRLAKFNLDDQQTDHFLGLPTPASGLFFASIPLVRHSSDFPFLLNLLDQPITFFILSFLISFLMVSSIPMFSLKIKNLKDSANIPAYLLIFISLVLLILFYLKAVFAIIILYIFMAVLKSIVLKKP